MKGFGSTSDLLISSIVFIAILTMITLYFTGNLSGEIFKSTCNNDITSQMTSFMQTMDSPGSSSSKGYLDVADFRVGRCVDYISEEGIKVDDSNKIRKFVTLAGNEVTFEIPEDHNEQRRIFSREQPYKVGISKPAKITFLLGESA